MKNIFISSTFRDMQAERDLVQEKVLPALREEAKKYGDNVGVIDLRWGVDTSTLETDEGSAKVLKVCLDEIDRSHPYMLIFLGERYGWIPNGSLIEKAIRDRGDKYVTDDFEKSVTALEIEYGALSEKYGDLSRCIVCFREPVTAMLDAESKATYAEQDEKGKQKLEELKERVRKELGDANRLISYTCEWDESAQVLKKFTSNGQALDELLIEKYIEMFQPEWEKYQDLSWQEKEQLGFRALMESKLRTFVGRDALLEECYQMAVSQDKPVILQGEVGSGKTALMSKLIACMQQEGKTVFPFFSGMGSMSKNADSLVQQMIYHVETLVGAEHVVENSGDRLDNNNAQMSNIQNENKSEYDLHLEYLYSLCSKLNDKIYIFLDALDQLTEDEHVEALDFLFATDKVQMIVSCTDTFQLNSATKLRMELLDIPMLTIEDAKLVAKGILRAESRDYYTELENALLEKKAIGSPLYISLLIQRLNMMDQEELTQVNTAEEIADYGAKVIAEMPDALDKAAVVILKNAVEKISGDAGGLLLEAVRFIAVSRNGLSSSDLRALFGARGEEIPALDITLLMKYLDSFFYVGEDDRINFTHKVIRAGILAEIEERDIYETQIKEYIKALDETATIYLQDGMYFARITADEEFARRLMCQASQINEERLLKSITEEAISDEGAFYSEILMKETEGQDAIRTLLQYQIISRFSFVRKEIMTKLALLRALIHCNEEWEKKEPNVERATDISISCIIMGNTLSSIGQNKEAMVYYQKNLEHVKNLYETQSTDDGLLYLVISYEAIAKALMGMGQARDAVAYYKKSLEYREQMHEARGDELTLSGLAVAYNNMGKVLRALGQREEAINWGQKACQYAEEMYKIRKDASALRNVAVAYDNLGDILIECAQLQEALACYSKTMEIHEKLHQQQTDPDILNSLFVSYSNMGRALSELGEAEKAFSYHEKALKYAKELHEVQGSEMSLRNLVVIYDLIGRGLGKAQKAEEALDYYQKGFEYAKELHEKQQSESSLLSLFINCNDMGYAYVELKEFEKAIEYFLEAETYAKELYEKQKSHEILEALCNLFSNISFVYKLLGNKNESFIYQMKALNYRNKK